MKNKTYYYSDVMNDDFAGNDIDTKLTEPDFVYLPRSPFYRAGAFLLYYGFAKPVTWLYIKIGLHQRYVGKKKIKSVRGRGCFFFINHTLEAGDAFIPNHMRVKKNYIVTGPDATSIPGIRTIVKMLGALPVPSCVGGARNFTSAVGCVVEKGHSVTVYPEAHIWPYYTKIRPFKADSFCLPASSGAPVFAVTNVFLKSRNKLRRRPVVKTYIDGPFYPDTDKPKRECAKELRDKVYEAMISEAEKQEQYVTNVFIKKETE